jgi:hypothetical protein
MAVAEADLQALLDNLRAAGESARVIGSADTGATGTITNR